MNGKTVSSTVSSQVIDEARRVIDNGGMAQIAGHSALTHDDLDRILRSLEEQASAAPLPTPLSSPLSFPQFVNPELSPEQAREIAEYLENQARQFPGDIVIAPPGTLHQVLEHEIEVGAEGTRAAGMVRDVYRSLWRNAETDADREALQQADLQTHLQVDQIEAAVDAAPGEEEASSEASSSEVSGSQPSGAGDADGEVSASESGTTDAGSAPSPSDTGEAAPDVAGTAVDGTPVPADFPGRAQLAAAGHVTLEAVRAIPPADLTKISGIGPASAGRILEALAATV